MKFIYFFTFLANAFFLVLSSVLANQTAENQKQILLGKILPSLVPPSSSSSNSKKSSASSSACVQNWKNETELCSFTGIFCNNETNLIEEVILTTSVSPVTGGAKANIITCPPGFYSFEGLLPPEFEEITTLKKLDLTGNFLLKGSLAPSWGSQMQNLEFLSLMNCQINNAPLPEEWGATSSNNNNNNNNNNSPSNLSKTLKWLNLANNYITSSLPASYSNFSSLEYLNLGLNNLHGSIPDSWGFGMTNLAYFGIVINNLEGLLPVSFENMRQMKYMNIAANRLTGTLPAWTKTMPNLKFFLGAVNFFEGLPESWSTSLPNLIQIVLTDNKITGKLPRFIANMTSLEELDLSGNLIEDDAIPDEWSELSNLIDLDLSGNKIKTQNFPISWARKLKNLQIVDLSANCISFEQNEQRNEDVLAEFEMNCMRLTTLDLTPNCDSVHPFNTSAQMAGPNVLRRSNPLGKFPSNINNNSVCQKCTNVPIEAGLFPGSIPRVFDLVFYCTDETRITFQNTLDFADSCISGFYRANLLCFEDVDLSIPCNQSTSSSSSSSSILPNWNNVTTNVPFLSSGALRFTGAVEAQYLYDAHYVIRFDISLNWVNSTRISLVQTTPPFQGPTCDQTSSIAIPLSTSCAPCPNLAQCDGSSSIQVASTTPSATAVPAWRIQNDLLPLYQCFKDLSVGCVSGDVASSSISNGNGQDVNLLFDGVRCLKGYVGVFCSKCEPGWGRVGSGMECEECPSGQVQAIYFSGGIGVLLLVITIFVYVSLEKVVKGKTMKNRANSDEKEQSGVKVSNGDYQYHEDDVDADLVVEKTPSEKDDDSSCSCCCCESCSSKCKSTFVTPLVKFFDRHQTKIEKLVVALRQLINHFSLVGALAQSAAGQELASSVQKLLLVQQSGNTFAFGSYAATLSCMFPDASSTSVLEFNLVWAVFGGVFVVESLIFLAWFRRGTVTAAVALFLSFLAYAPLTENATKLLALCKTYSFFTTRDYLLLTPEHATPVITLSRLSTDIEQNCDDPGFSRHRIAAALTLVLFSLGLPIFIVVVRYYLSRRVIRIFTESVGHEDGTTTKEANGGEKDHEEIVYRQCEIQLQIRDEILSFLTQNYKSDVWYWELVVFIRKACVALIFSVFSGFGDLQLQLYSAVCTILLIFSFNLEPLESKTANYVDQLSISSAAVCAVLMSLVSAFPTSNGVAIFTAFCIFLTQIITLCAVFVVAVFDMTNERNGEKRKKSSESNKDNEEMIPSRSHLQENFLHVVDNKNENELEKINQRLQKDLDDKNDEILNLKEQIDRLMKESKKNSSSNNKSKTESEPENPHEV